MGGCDKYKLKLYGFELSEESGVCLYLLIHERYENGYRVQ